MFGKYYSQLQWLLNIPPHLNCIPTLPGTLVKTNVRKTDNNRQQACWHGQQITSRQNHGKWSAW